MIVNGAEATISPWHHSQNYIALVINVVVYTARKLIGQHLPFHNRATWLLSVETSVTIMSRIGHEPEYISWQRTWVVLNGRLGIKMETRVILNGPRNKSIFKNHMKRYHFSTHDSKKDNNISLPDELYFPRFHK